MNCIKVDTGWWKKKESSSTRNLEEPDQGRNVNNREDLRREELEKGAMEISGLSLMCHLGALGLCYVYNCHSLHRISLAFVNPDVYLDIHVHVRNVFSKCA